jgi:hypothetical protein
MAKFLEEAAPIVATERGLTPRANLLLQSLADRIGLSDKGREDALAKLKAQFENLSPETKAKLAKFREAVKQILSQRQSAILTSKHERELVDQAVAKFGIEAAPASLAIREAAADVEVRFVPYDEAVRHIEDLIRDRLETLDYLPSEVEGILKKSAVEWGISGEDFAALVESTTDKHHEDARRVRKRQSQFIQAIVVTIVVATVVLVGVIVLRQGDSKVANNAKNRDSSGGTSADPSSSSATKDSFWNEALAEAYDRWAGSHARAVSIREAISSRTPADRTKGYQWLAEAIATQKGDEAKSSQASILWQRLYATEPDEEAAHTLCDASLALLTLPRPLTKVEPSSAMGINMLLEGMLGATGTKLVTPERRQHLRDALTGALKISPPADKPAKDWAPSARSALARQWLTELSLLADAQPSLAAQWTLALRPGVSAVLPADERAGLEVEIGLRAALALPANEDSTAVARLVSDAISSRDTDTVLRVIDAYEGIQSKSLAQALSSKLLTRVGIDSAVATADVATEVRKRLGGKKPATSSSSVASRQTRWRKLVQANEAVRDRSANDPETLLRDTVTLARLANLGEALRRGDMQGDWFDKAAGGELTVEVAPTDAESVAIATDPLSDLTPQERNVFKSYSTALATPKDMAVGKRQSFFHMISTLSDRIDDVPSEAAYAIATYLLMPKGSDEAEQVARDAEKVRKWPRLQIALADGWKQSELDRQHLHQLWVVFTATDGTVSDVHTTRPRHELQQLALRTLSESRSKDKPASAVDQLADRLAQQYIERLRLRAPGENMLPDAKASDVLAKLLPRVLGVEPSDAEQILAGLSIAAENDLQKVVLLQRTILEREVTVLSRVRPQAAAKLRSLVDALAERDLQSDNVVRQIRDGENTLLSMLMAVYDE